MRTKFDIKIKLKQTIGAKLKKKEVKKNETNENKKRAKLNLKL